MSFLSNIHSLLTHVISTMGCIEMSHPQLSLTSTEESQIEISDFCFFSSVCVCYQLIHWFTSDKQMNHNFNTMSSCLGLFNVLTLLLSFKMNEKGTKKLAFFFDQLSVIPHKRVDFQGPPWGLVSTSINGDQMVWPLGCFQCNICKIPGIILSN